MDIEKRTVPNSILLGEVSALLSEGRPVVIMTKGNSMLPFIRGEKDSVCLEAPADLASGDIVLAQVRPGLYVLHRFLGESDGTATLKGDGNLVSTESCPVEAVCGKVSRIIRGGGREVPCDTRSFRRRSRLWRNSPLIARRIFLAIYRRLFI